MSCGIKKQKVSKQRGGSPASDLVMANLKDLSSSQRVPQGCALKGDMNSLKLYQPSGGARRSRSRSHSRSRSRSRSRKSSKSRKTGRKGLKSRKGKKGNKSKKSMKSNKRNSKSHRVMRGGSDWISTQYSQGNINAAQNTDWKNFSASEPSARDMLMNPPTLGLAGSGGGESINPMEGSVKVVGAPLV